MKVKSGPIPRGQKRRVFVKSFADHWGVANPASQWQPSRKKQSKKLKQPDKSS